MRVCGWRNPVALIHFIHFVESRKCPDLQCRHDCIDHLGVFCMIRFLVHDAEVGVGVVVVEEV